MGGVKMVTLLPESKSFASVAWRKAERLRRLKREIVGTNAFTGIDIFSLCLEFANCREGVRMVAAFATSVGPKGGLFLVSISKLCLRDLA
jgi:hypothetical protein